MEIIRLALRNLSRQKKRSIMLAVAIGFGFFVVTAIDGLSSGAVGNLENQITQLVGGDVIVQGVERAPSSEEGKKGKLSAITRDHTFVKKLLDESGISYKYISQRTTTSGQLLFNTKTVVSAVYGCDFLDEKHLVDSFVVDSGSLEDLKESDALVLSRKTADSLKVEVGEKLLYTTRTITGQNTVGEFKVVAITKDAGLLGSIAAYARQDTINKLVEMPEGGYDTFSITLKNGNGQSAAANMMEYLIRKSGKPVTNRMEAIKSNPKNPAQALQQQLKKADWKGTMYTVASLDDAVPQLGQLLSVVHIVTTCILLVILLIVMVGISNTYRMILYERIREIGTLRAIGMTGKDTGNIFVSETLILSLAGAVAGFVLAIIGMAVFGLFVFHNDAMSFFLRDGHATFSLSVGSVIGKYLLMIVLTILAVHGTAKRAARMSPAAALRTVK